MRRKIFPLPAILLAAAIPAQNVAVFPSDHQSVANGSSSSNNLPYAQGISRIQAIYESWDLGIPNGAQITRIGFRRDPGAMQNGHGLQLQVLMGSTTRTAGDAQGQFAANYTSGTPGTVFGPGLYQLPPLSSTSEIWLDLTTPHTFNANENLLVEWRVLANSNGNSPFTYPLDRGTFLAPVTQGASGCQHSGGRVTDLQFNATEVGGFMSISLRSGPANSLLGLFLSVNSPLQTPYLLTPFLPGINTTCQGQLALGGLLSLTDMTNGSGNRNWSFRIPNDRVTWNDATIAGQAVVFDFFSPGGAVVSDAEMVEIGIAPAVTFVRGTNNAMATTGSVIRNYGVVTMFQYQ